MSKKERLIYLAGIVDGEGNIGIMYQHPGGRTKKYSVPHITISNTNLEVLVWIKDNFGGGVCRIRKASDHNKECWQWRISWDKARLLAIELQPYLIIKREQVLRILPVPFT